MKHMIIALIVLTVLCVGVFTAGSIAFFTDGDDDRLIITMDGSNLSGEIVETTVTEDGEPPIIGPTTLRIVPGAVVSKTVAIKNTGTMNMYVRLTVDKVFTLSEVNSGEEADPSLVELRLNTEKWELRDGFYYYKDVLLSGKSTEPLFTELRFSPYMNNLYTNSTLTLTIKAYATQIPASADSVFDVTSWPAVEGEGR